MQLSLHHFLRMLKTPWIKQVLFTVHPCAPIPCDGIWAMGHEQEALLGWSIQESVGNALTLFSPTIIQRKACTEVAGPEDTNKQPGSLCPSIEGERGEWKSWLKLNIQKTKIMASSPISSWQIDGETVETVADFIFWGSKSLQMVTAAMKLKHAYSLEEKLWPT